MAKSDVDRIQNLLINISARLGDFSKCLSTDVRWRRSAEVAGLADAMRDEVLQKELMLKAGGDIAVDRLLEDVKSLNQAISAMPRNIQVRFQGQIRDAQSLLEQFLGSIQNMLNGVQYGLNRMTADQLRDAIPTQKVAAYQFAFDGDKLVVAPQPAQAADPDYAIAAAALRSLVEQGERVARELSQSNCPPRLIEAFAALQAKLESHENVVEIGMLNRSCMSLASASADELASTLIEWLKSHLVSVYDFLAQHPDWRRFVENALSANLRQDQVGDLATAARAVAAVAARSDKVDAAVPSAFEGIALLADEIKEPDGRVTLGLGRTLENIISLATRCLLGLKGDVQSEARKMLARSILLAISGAAIATLALIPGAEWVPSALSQGLHVFGN
jgi:hypothetical protein